MKNLIKSALVASLLVGSVGIASAAVHVGFDLGNVAIGYNDGYMDNDHHFHRWAHRSDMNSWRSAHADMYHSWRHDDRHHH